MILCRGFWYPWVFSEKRAERQGVIEVQESLSRNSFWQMGG